MRLEKPVRNTLRLAMDLLKGPIESVELEYELERPLEGSKIDHVYAYLSNGNTFKTFPYGNILRVIGHSLAIGMSTTFDDILFEIEKYERFTGSDEANNITCLAVTTHDNEIIVSKTFENSNSLRNIDDNKKSIGNTRHKQIK